MLNLYFLLPISCYNMINSFMQSSRPEKCDKVAVWVSDGRWRDDRVAVWSPIVTLPLTEYSILLTLLHIANCTLFISICKVNTDCTLHKAPYTLHTTHYIPHTTHDKIHFTNYIQKCWNQLSNYKLMCKGQKYILPLVLLQMVRFFHLKIPLVEYFVDNIRLLIVSQALARTY